jgi:hypothetical protein
MGSSLLPIILFVILVVGATVFVVLSFRSGRYDYRADGSPDAAPPFKKKSRQPRYSAPPKDEEDLWGFLNNPISAPSARPSGEPTRVEDYLVDGDLLPQTAPLNYTSPSY